MQDKRIERLAQVAVEYSTRIKKGDLVIIRGDVIAKPLLFALYEQVVRKGAHPVLRPTLDGLSTLFYTHASAEQLQYVTPFEELTHDQADVSIAVWGGGNTKNLVNIDKSKHALHMAARKHLQKRFHIAPEQGGIRWVVVPYPSPFLAQAANMPDQEYEEFVFNACMVGAEDPIAEWYALKERQQKIVDYLNTHRTFHITGEHVDLRFDTQGTQWVNCDGTVNLPDGEVYTCPSKQSLSGNIRFSYPGFYAGKEVEGVEITFKDGCVAQASAKTNQDFLHEMIAMDEGSRRVGEIAFGTNNYVKTYTRNVLFDEKIGGTMHLALGNSATGTRGEIVSAIHWDIVTEMKMNSQMYADDELVYQNGRFLVE